MIHGVSNSYIDELLKYLSIVLLPAMNMLPSSHYEAKKLIRKLGFNYDIIHTCPNGCVFYRGDNENLKECPNVGCGKSRFVEIVLLLIYNLPPYLVTKKFFIQLSILVFGKLSQTNENTDVFIRPIIEELQKLWTGVLAQDFSKPPGERYFILRGLLLWTISDYPAYGLISGLYTHGYKACTVCGPSTDGRAATSGNKVDAHKKAKGRKIVYGGSRRWTS